MKSFMEHNLAFLSNVLFPIHATDITKSILIYGSFKVYSLIMETFCPFPAFSYSGQENLLPATISHSSFPVRELRSLATRVEL